MFIGHYGLGYMIKKKFDGIPLWMLFLSVQLLDFVAFILVWCGVETAGYSENANPFFRNHLDLPFSHSLTGAILLSAFVYIVCYTLKRHSWALVLSLCVFSHWFIDVIVHTPDLAIFFGSMKVGLGLWNYPYLSYALEIILVLSGWLLIKYRSPVSFLLLFLMIGSLTGMVFGKEPDVTKNNQMIRIAMVFFSNALFLAFAYLSEKSAKKGNRL
jgi:hypothetical protein